jgi:hypothetical protein
MLGVIRVTRAVIELRLLVHAGLEADGPLVALIAQDRHYLSVVKQRVADWAKLAEATR